ARQGLRGYERTGTKGRGRPDPATRAEGSGPTLPPVSGRSRGRAVRPPPHHAPLASNGGGAVPPGVEAPPEPTASPRAGAGRLRFDVALQQGARRIRPRRRLLRPAGRGVLLRHPPHSPDPPPPHPRPRRSAGGRGGRGQRLGGRHEDRRLPQAAPRRVGVAFRAPRERGRPVLRRPRAGRSLRVAEADAASVEAGLPTAVGEPTEGKPALRAPGTRYGRFPSVRRRVPARTQPGEPGRAGRRGHDGLTSGVGQPEGQSGFGLGFRANTSSRFGFALGSLVKRSSSSGPPRSPAASIRSSSDFPASPFNRMRRAARTPACPSDSPSATLI